MIKMWPQSNLSLTAKMCGDGTIEKKHAGGKFTPG